MPVDPVAFFHEYAGWSYGPNETPEQGRARCARVMAEDEAWGRDNGVRFEWRHDEYHDRSGIDHGGPLWWCSAWRDGAIVASCGGIDLGETGTPWGDPQARVMEAELAGTAKEKQ